jgi:hypothetical protein
MAEQFLNLQHSESVVAQMSATIFASLVQSHGLTEANEEQLAARSVVIAIKLAKYTEQLVKSDEEWMQKSGTSSYLIG